MAYQRSNTGRAHQVSRWLADYHPTPHPVRLTFTHDHRGAYGHTWRDGRYLHIELNATLRGDLMLAYLVHEWAHAAIWPHARIEDDQLHHGPEWGVTYAAIYSSFYEGGGAESSREY